MSLALYRKYRPRTFAELIGQDHIRTTLVNQLASGKVAHAYLFSGPRGIGKTTTARLVARSINCSHPKKGEPDNTCDACKEMLAQRSLDIIEIDAASNTGVDHVREHIIENARFTPHKFPYKVFIIDEVHMLSTSAFNALLKTLEEPPQHVVFILATTEVHRVPETIISRCQRFDFQKIKVADLVIRLRHIAELESVTVEEPVLQAIARYAKGASRDAEVVLGQLLALGEKKITRDHADLVLPRSDIASLLELARSLSQHDGKAGLTVISRMMDEGVHLQEFMSQFIELLRKVLIVKITDGIPDAERDGADEQIVGALSELAGSFETNDLIALVERCIERKKEMKYSALPQLPLELVVIEHAAPPEPSNAHSKKQQNPLDRPSIPPRLPSRDKLEKTESKPIPASSEHKAANASMSIEGVRGAWPKVLEAVRKDHRGLYLVLRSGKPIRVDGSAIIFGLPYKLLADQVRRSTPVIEGVLQEVTGLDLGITGIVVPKSELEEEKAASPVAQDAPADGVHDIIDAFGGEVVAEE
ncbi:MAG: DNA polymerase III, subunit gamma and tau [Candidatus Kerfeldbacteria bacterium RIFCSPLOWO2_01_FULL_48_11]|uniref:DNA polymerase III subunit gamma/tau n=1 Tax=Candidatus Kerfeldbacteria bacterium RIFCSPLOWO2_01_FULL_48_11 TaxID=1798543 RepID=A0A1G2B392_9BACT|nr:MAG: polymerase III, subunit gamma and tau protein [Parcubacteria group bacterium GW2011_GWA2_48_9]KKW14542.1 MAG: polymerase III, subunit gamma and tau protein [Parcubacteria group bacterium GW2011_GWC2_49_9]OGY83119.1 MAG: DNA polymerase III, subunit gamma and tau [Candidatus Kerfeldbacteria bacterium RIFCSPLOWO2_01_FULL_48_11]